MKDAKTGNETLAEALTLLEEAATQKKDELKNLMTDKYTHLRGAIMDVEKGLAHSLSNVKKHTLDAVSHAGEVSSEKVKQIASDVDESAHQYPWAYIGGAAVVGLLIGYIAGRDRK